jgi:membrane protein
MRLKLLRNSSDWLPVNKIPELLKDSVNGFIDDRAMYMGAALAYYTILALVPMTFLLISLFGTFVGKNEIETIIQDLFKSNIGLSDSSLIVDLVEQMQWSGTGFLAKLFGIVALLVVSSAFVVYFKHSINELFGIRKKFENRKKKILNKIVFRLISMGIVGGVAVVVISFYFIQAFVISSLDQVVTGNSSLEFYALQFVKHILSVGMNLCIFMFIFKYLHDGYVRWKLAFFGALITAVLLYLGQLLINYYLLHFFFAAKSGGVAGLLFIILAYVYYSSQILFFGAKLIAVYANKIGKPIKAI